MLLLLGALPLVHREPHNHGDPVAISGAVSTEPDAQVPAPAGSAQQAANERDGAADGGNGASASMLTRSGT
jgi:hypothetical protein